MCEICIQNFLKKSDPSCVERHSESSDFEEPFLIPEVVRKSGIHCLLRDKILRFKAEKECSNNINGNIKKYNEYRSKYTKTKTYETKSQCVDNKHKKLENVNIKDDKRSRGDQNTLYLEEYPKYRVRNKILPCLSTIFKRSNNCLIYPDNENENHFNATYSKQSYPHCLHEKYRKQKCQHVKYALQPQPVYAVKDIHNFPNRLTETILKCKNTDNFTTKRNAVYSHSSTGSEKEIDNYKYEKQLRRYKKEIDILNKCHKNECKLHNYKIEQQNPLTYEMNEDDVFPPCCHPEMRGRIGIGLEQENSKPNLEYSSSAFWKFLEKKINKKPTLKNDVKDGNFRDKHTQCCTSECCNDNDKSDGVEMNNDKLSTSKLSTSKKNKKNIPEDGLECKCKYEVKPKKKKKGKKEKGLKISNSTSSQEDSIMSCQEPHDRITKAVLDKYNGEILCIHNPPCILINGCLNLQPPKTLPVQATSWPVTTQIKKHSFAQMCKKIKRTKQKKYEQSSQYHPPYLSLEQYAPDSKTEKTIQSSCNHNPPCQIVHRCNKKARYYSQFSNSCIHVPKCGELPECLIEGKSLDEETVCAHEPKCKDVPLCARNYIVLSTKESIATQAESRMVCLHEPTCLMIPKCLAQLKCNDRIPFKVIPGCSHIPCCEMVPACCRKYAEHDSQQPASCRIV